MELGVSRALGRAHRARRINERLGLGNNLLSDEDLGVLGAVELPASEREGKRAGKRAALAVEGGAGGAGLVSCVSAG